MIFISSRVKTVTAGMNGIAQEVDLLLEYFKQYKKKSSVEQTMKLSVQCVMLNKDLLTNEDWCTRGYDRCNCLWITHQ